MTYHERYKHLGDLPEVIALFPLQEALLLPRAHLPLNIFEPRYLQMVEHAISGDRIIGMIQPATASPAAKLPDGPTHMINSPLCEVGCAGRIVSYTETTDGRILVTLEGVCRFGLREECDTDLPFRMARVSYTRFSDDLIPGFREAEVNRERLLATFQAYLEAHKLHTDWKDVSDASNESLVNTLSVISPYSGPEKQALLEAEDLRSRAEVLVALTEMVLAKTGDIDSGLQ